MELSLADIKSTLTVSDNIFGKNFNQALVHQVIVAYKAGNRQGTKNQKSRGEVAGSGKKPWRQKGTGRARAGSMQSPIWRSGGVTFAAKCQDHSQKVNRKMFRGALKSIFSKLVSEKRLVIVKQFSIEAPKTKLLVQKLKVMALEDVLIIISKTDKNLFLAARNLYKIVVTNVKHIDPVSLITFNRVMITVDSIKEIEGMLG